MMKLLPVSIQKRIMKTMFQRVACSYFRLPKPIDTVTVLSGGHPDFAFVREQMDRAADELGFFSLASGGARVADIRCTGALERGRVRENARLLSESKAAGRRLAEAIRNRTTKGTDIKGDTVGVYGPSATYNYLMKIKADVPDLKVDVTPDDIAAFKKLSAGRINAVYSNREVGFAMLKKLGLENIRFAGRHTDTIYHVAFSKKSVAIETVNQFNDAYKALYKKGVIAQIVKKYSLEPIKLE